MVACDVLEIWLFILWEIPSGAAGVPWLLVPSAGKNKHFKYHQGYGWASSLLF